MLEEGVSFLSDEAEDLREMHALEFDSDVDGYAVSKVAEHLCRDGSGKRSGDDLIDSVESFKVCSRGYQPEGGIGPR